jgi:hypothetical protein
MKQTDRDRNAALAQLQRAEQRVVDVTLEAMRLCDTLDHGPIQVDERHADAIRFAVRAYHSAAEAWAQIAADAGPAVWHQSDTAPAPAPAAAS